MSYTVRFKLYKEEVQAFRKFCSDVGLPPEVTAKQALFYAISDAYNRAKALEQEQANQLGAQPDGEGSTRDTQGDTPEGSTSEGIDSSLHAE